MSFWQQSKKEIKRLISLDLHSYWEVFYFDLMACLLSFLITPLVYLMDCLGATEDGEIFVKDNIITPLEKSTVRQIAPSGLADCTYQSITYGLVYLAELVVFHLMICAMFAYKKSKEHQMGTAIEVDSGRCYLPQFMRRSTRGEEEEEKASLWQRAKSELKRLWNLELNSCWELFYLDVILVVFSLLFSFPLTFIIYLFHLEKVTIEPYIDYIEKPLENAIVRPVVESIQYALPAQAPAGLSDYSYKIITLIAIDICILIVFHCLNCYLYLSERNRKPVKTVVDVESGTTCFPRSRVALKGEKKRRLEKVYQSMIPAPSTYLTADKLQLIKKAFP